MFNRDDLFREPAGTPCKRSARLGIEPGRK